MARKLLPATLLVALLTPLFADGASKVSIKAENRDIREVITSLARAAAVKVVLQPEVRGLVTTTIQAMPFEQALTAVAATRGYRWRLVDGTYHVGRFSASQDGRTVRERLELHRYQARALARAFGWLDLDSLGEPGSTVDLRPLLPPGLEGPPQPTATGNALLVTGKASAVEDLRYLLGRLESGAAIHYDVLVGLATPDLIDSLPVPWARGPVNFATSPGRETQSGAADFGALLSKLKGGFDGFTKLAEGAADSYDLGLIGVEHGAAGDADHRRVRLAGRVEDALRLSVWMEALIRTEQGEVTVRIDGVTLAPEEGLIAVSRPAPGGEGPGPVIVMVVPQVKVPE